MLNVPAQLIAGDTWSWTDDLANYPAGTWTLTFYFWNGASTFNVAATPSSTSHVSTVSAAVSAQKGAGRYRWRARVTDGSTVTTIDEGWTEVQENPSQAKGDPRGHARRVLDALEATIEGRATNDQLSMQIAGRSLSRIPIADLLLLQDKYRGKVAAEEQGTKAGAGRNIKLRVSRA